MGADASAYLKEMNPFLLNHLILMGKLRTYLADLNEQANERCRLFIQQMPTVEGVTENLKYRAQWEWVRAMNSIASRAEEIIKYLEPKIEAAIKGRSRIGTGTEQEMEQNIKSIVLKGELAYGL